MLHAVCSLMLCASFKAKAHCMEITFPLLPHVYNLIGYRDHEYPQTHKIHLNKMHNSTYLWEKIAVIFKVTLLLINLCINNSHIYEVVSIMPEHLVKSL